MKSRWKENWIDHSSLNNLSLLQFKIVISFLFLILIFWEPQTFFVLLQKNIFFFLIHSLNAEFPQKEWLIFALLIDHHLFYIYLAYSSGSWNKPFFPHQTFYNVQRIIILKRNLCVKNYHWQSIIKNNIVAIVITSGEINCFLFVFF